MLLAVAILLMLFVAAVVVGKTLKLILHNH